MRDWLATLLQVSHSARKCGSELGECASQWETLLKAVSARRGCSVSEMMCACMVRSLQVMDGVQLTDHEIDALALPSYTNEMESSLITKSLDDHTLGYVFDFLDVKDVCTSIECTSHRFLRVSRQRRQPFKEECLVWRDRSQYSMLSRESFIQNPLDELVYSSFHNDVIRLRSLSRFKVNSINFDPRLAASKQLAFSTLDFNEVLNRIAPGVQNCFINVRSLHFNDEGCVFPAQLSHVRKIMFYAPEPSQFKSLSQGFQNCQSLTIGLSNFSNPHQLALLNQLAKLEELTLVNPGFERSSEETHTSMILNPGCLPNLRKVAVDSNLLRYLNSILTPQIRSLCLFFETSLHGIPLSGDLTGLHHLTMQGVSDPRSTRSIVDQIKLPKRIPEMTLSSTWMILTDWVDRVNLLTFNKQNPGQGGTIVTAEMERHMISKWSVKDCTFRISMPTIRDLQTVNNITEHARDCVFTLIILHFADTENEKDQLIDQLQRKHNCQIIHQEID